MAGRSLITADFARGVVCEQKAVRRRLGGNAEIQLTYHASPAATTNAGRVLNAASVLHSAAAYGFLKVMAAELGDPNSHMFAMGLTGFEGSNGHGRARGPSLPVAATGTPSPAQREGGLYCTGVHGTVAFSGSLLLPRLLSDQPGSAPHPAMGPHHAQPQRAGRASFSSVVCKCPLLVSGAV